MAMPNFASISTKFVKIEKKKIDGFKIWWDYQSTMEGLYSNNKYDAGGETMRGITLATYRAYCGNDYNSFRNMTAETARMIAYNHFWLPFAKFNDWRLNVLICSSFWGGGGYALVKDMQKILNIHPDGIIGEVTILAANQAGTELFHKLVNCRIKYLRGCWNYEYFKGWGKTIKFLENL